MIKNYTKRRINPISGRRQIFAYLLLTCFILQTTFSNYNFNLDPNQNEAVNYEPTDSKENTVETATTPSHISPSYHITTYYIYPLIYPFSLLSS